MKVYLISGLGADERAFRNIILPPGYEAVHLPWFPPLHRETLEAYALRMAAKIDRDEPFVLMGLSLGGMIATEIAWHLKPVQTILISSIPSARQMPPLYRWAGRMRLHRFIPVGWIKSGVVVKRLFMSETASDQQAILDMVRVADPVFIRWAFQAVLDWKREVVLPGLVHIHGSRDELFPLRFVQPTHIVRNGRHLMILNDATAINALLRGLLAPTDG